MRHPARPAGLAAALLIAALAAPGWAQTTTQPATEGQPATTESQPAQAGDQPATTEGQPATEGQATGSGGQPAASGTESASQAQTAEKPLEERGYALGDVVLGDPNAPLTVIEYASFTCPHCGAFAIETWPEVKEQYIETGKVRWIIRDVYFDQYGLWASMVARCGGEEGYYPMAETFLTTQSTWTRAPDIGAAIAQIGRRAGLPADRVEQCLSDREYAKKLIETYQQNMAADQVKSTPTFIIGGEQHSGSMAFEDFSELLEAAL